jgi:transposase
MSIAAPVTIAVSYAGLDVAKATLALHLAGRRHDLPNTPSGHRQLVRLLHKHPAVQLVCEASGGYEQAPARALWAAGIPVSIVEAGRVRHYARARGRRAKSDPIDAEVLAQFGAAVRPCPTPPPSPLADRLAALVQRRRQLQQTLVAETNRAAHYIDPLLRRQTAQLLRLLRAQIQACAAETARLLAQDAGLAAKIQRLTTVPGVGPVVAATLVAELPELGQLRDEAAAALVGVAPYDRDSGRLQGSRRIAGGRRTVRCALFMATLSAVRHDRILKAHHQHLLARGKKPLVALTACLRKLLILLNRLLKNPHFQLAG